MAKSILLVIVAWLLVLLLAPAVFVVMGIYHLFITNIAERYLVNVAIGIDQFGSTLLGFDPDTTVSGNIGYRMQKGTATPPERWLCYFLRWLDVDHCKKSIEEDERYDTYNGQKDSR